MSVKGKRAPNVFNFNTPKTRYTHQVIKLPRSERATKVENLRTTPIYPWDEWCDGSWWVIYRGKDFPGWRNLQNMKATLHDHGHKYGYFVRTFTTPENDGLVFQFYQGWKNLRVVREARDAYYQQYGY